MVDKNMDNSLYMFVLRHCNENYVAKLSFFIVIYDLPVVGKTC